MSFPALPCSCWDWGEKRGEGLARSLASSFSGPVLRVWTLLLCPWVSALRCQAPRSGSRPPRPGIWAWSSHHVHSEHQKAHRAWGYKPQIRMTFKNLFSQGHYLDHTLGTWPCSFRLPDARPSGILAPRFSGPALCPAHHPAVFLTVPVSYLEPTVWAHLQLTGLKEKWFRNL